LEHYTFIVIMSRNSQEPPASIQEQLNEILGLLRSQGAEISETKKMLADSQIKVSQLESKVQTLEKEVKKLKESANDRDQADKYLTVRLFGYPITEVRTEAKLSKLSSMTAFSSHASTAPKPTVTCSRSRSSRRPSTRSTGRVSPALTAPPPS
jgi:septal ring factor EnvC (AmiA/AmiB activator)